MNKTNGTNPDEKYEFVTLSVNNRDKKIPFSCIQSISYHDANFDGGVMYTLTLASNHKIFIHNSNCQFDDVRAAAAKPLTEARLAQCVASMRNLEDLDVLLDSKTK